jgi:hypothetical protein
MFGVNICLSHKPTDWDNQFDINIHGHIHDGGEYHDTEIGHLRDDRHYLIALELQNYSPLRLLSIVEHFNYMKKNGFVTKNIGGV